MRHLIISLLLAASAFAQQAPPNWGTVSKAYSLAEKGGFANPDMAYAPFMFWFWDEPLDSAKMARMARTMTEQGFAPGYAHARRSMVGTPDLPDAQWLGDQWFGAFSASLTEAERAGSYLGYCDEYWWPSLQANGRVLRAHPELQATSLACQTLDVPAGGSVRVPQSFFAVAARLAQPLAAQPLAARLGRWVWHPDRVTSEGTVWFAASIELPAGATVKAAAGRASADNAYTLYLDGQRVASGDVWMTPESFDLTGRLTPGRHLVTVEARNLDGPAALNVGLAARLADGREINLTTDATWRARLDKPASWPKADLTAAGWVAVKDLGDSTAAPYHLPAADEGRTQAVIDASSLRVIGGGQAFDWRAPAGDDHRVYIFTQYHAPGVDGGAVNYLDARLAPAFINIALDPYAKRYAGKLGKSIPGDFIDNEGDYGRGLAWSATLEEHFAKRFGREMGPLMPLMIDRDAKGAELRFRYEWFEAVSDCYAHTFAALTRWHEARGMYTTAHFWEEGLQPQLNAVGDHLKMLGTLTMPGQDCLGDKVLRPHDFVEAASAAAWKRTRAMSEVMGAGGWNHFDPVFLKRALNNLTAFGISHQILHGVFATRKMDGNPWMPDWFDENPMWPMMHHYADFARRASFMVAATRPEAEVMLYHPMESVWANADASLLDRDLWSMPESSPGGRRINQINRVYAQAIDELSAANVQFLVGGRQQIGAGTDHCTTVILPPMDLIDGYAAERLLVFARSGGRVVALGELPTASSASGGGDRRLAALMAELRRLPTFVQANGSLAPLLRDGRAGLVPPLRWLSKPFPLKMSLRSGDGKLCWLANDTTERQSATFRLPEHWESLAILRCEDGSRQPVAATHGRDGVTVRLTFEPLEAYWLVAGAGSEKLPPYTGPTAALRPLATVDGPWTVRCNPAEQPPLEHPAPVPAELLAGSVKPLADWQTWGLARFSGRLDYTTAFDAPTHDGSVYIDLGRVAHAAQVWVNDQSVGDLLWGPYRLDITKALRPGRNTLRVRVANLINNSYGQVRDSGLFGPVRLLQAERAATPLNKH